MMLTFRTRCSFTVDSCVIQPVFIQFVIQCRPAYPQQLRGQSLVAVRLFQGTLDAFLFLLPVFQCETNRGGALFTVKFQVFSGYHIAPGLQDCREYLLSL